MLNLLGLDMEFYYATGFAFSLTDHGMSSAVRFAHFTTPALSGLLLTQMRAGRCIG